MPDFFGSITPFFKIYNFDISFQFNYSVGGKAYDFSYATLMSTGGLGNAKSVDIITRWTSPGQITDVPRMDNSATTNFNAVSDRWLVSSSFVSLKNISVSYNFKPSILKNLNVKGLKVYAMGENLALFTARKGLDPTQNFNGEILNKVGFFSILLIAFSTSE